MSRNRRRRKSSPFRRVYRFFNDSGWDQYIWDYTDPIFECIGNWTCYDPLRDMGSVSDRWLYEIEAKCRRNVVVDKYGRCHTWRETY